MMHQSMATLTISPKGVMLQGRMFSQRIAAPLDMPGRLHSSIRGLKVPLCHRAQRTSKAPSTQPMLFKIMTHCLVSHRMPCFSSSKMLVSSCSCRHQRTSQAPDRLSHPRAHWITLRCPCTRITFRFRTLHKRN